MPAILCPSCGKLTNTALCNHFEPDGKCEVRINTATGHWERGCGIPTYSADMIGNRVVVNDQPLSIESLRETELALRNGKAVDHE